MAKSFHTIIDDGFFEVDHKGDLVTLALPEMFQEIKGLTEDKTKLVEWIERNDIVLQVIQCAIQKRFIELRAIARPTVKKYKDLAGFEAALRKIPTNEVDDWNIDKKNLELSLKITADKESQSRLNEAKWTPVLRPGTNSKENVKKQAEIDAVTAAVKPWLAMGKTGDEIKELYKEAFSNIVLSQAINQAMIELEES